MRAGANHFIGAAGDMVLKVWIIAVVGIAAITFATVPYLLFAAAVQVFQNHVSIVLR